MGTVDPGAPGECDIPVGVLFYRLATHSPKLSITLDSQKDNNEEETTMKEPSRKREKDSKHDQKIKMNVVDSIGNSFLVLIGICALVFIVSYPLVLIPVFLLALLFWYFDRKNKQRIEELVQSRQGESICNFARSFDYRKLDTRILRAVYEQLQMYVRYEDMIVPIRADDHIFDDLEIDEEDFEYMVADQLTLRTQRSLDNYEQNPYYDKVNTVRDLVMFLHHQPREQGAV